MTRARSLTLRSTIAACTSSSSPSGRTKPPETHNTTRRLREDHLSWCSLHNDIDAVMVTPRRESDLVSAAAKRIALSHLT